MEIYVIKISRCQTLFSNSSPQICQLEITQKMRFCGRNVIRIHSLGKWLSVRLRAKWLWVWFTLLSLKLQIWRLLRARSPLRFRQTIECGFTLKLVRDMIITYRQIHFWSQFQLFSFLNEALQFYNFEGANLKQLICFFQILS